VTVQARTALCPRLTVPGVAVKALMTGGCGRGFTVSVALRLSVLPAALVTRQLNVAPLSARTVALSRRLAAAAPGMSTWFRRHW